MTAFRVPTLVGRLIYQDISEMYYYRNLTPEQQNEVVEYRRQQFRPWHSPPHWSFEGEKQFLISGTCFEHAHVIGASHERMTECENDMLEVCGNYARVIYAWCILPNHYHILVKTDRLEELRKESRANLKNPLPLRIIPNRRPMPFEASRAPAQREKESI